MVKGRSRRVISYIGRRWRVNHSISDIDLAYSEHVRWYLADCGLPKEKTYVTGSPMAEVLMKTMFVDLVKGEFTASSIE